MTIETLLILDTETGGLDPATDPILEIAGVLWSIPHACVLDTFSRLVQSTSNAAEHANRIPVAALANATPLPQVAAEFTVFAFPADVMVAHNAPFDRSFLESEEDFDTLFATQKCPWLCTQNDLEYPRSTSSRSLVTLALAHDVGVVTAHRALADCLTLARLFERLHELGTDLPAFFARGLRPKMTYKAEVSYDDRQLAKDARFHWESDAKRWVRRMAVDDALILPFPTTLIGP